MSEDLVQHLGADTTVGVADPRLVMDDIAALMAIPVVTVNKNNADDAEERMVEEDLVEEELDSDDSKSKDLLPQPPLHVVISMEERIRALEQSLKQQKELCEELQRSALGLAVAEGGGGVILQQQNDSNSGGSTKKASRSKKKRAGEGGEEGGERKAYRVSEARAYVTANVDDPKVAEKLVRALGDDIIDPPPRCLIRAFLHACHKKIKNDAT